MMDSRSSYGYWSKFDSGMEIEQILSKDDFTLEELLAEDTIIQECKYMNSNLLLYLSKPEVIRELISYIITVPNTQKNDVDGNDDGKVVDGSNIDDTSNNTNNNNENIDSNDEKNEKNDVNNSNNNNVKDVETLRKYANVCAEIFMCEVSSIIENLIGDVSLLNYLFSFIETKDNLEPLNAGNFRKVVVVLTQKKYKELMTYIKENKPSIIDNLINHSGLFSIMELLNLMFIWDETGIPFNKDGQDEHTKWLYKNRLVPKLLEKFDPKYAKQGDTHENVATTFKYIMKSPAKKSLLISHLNSDPMLKLLFKHMFSGNISSLDSTISVVIELIKRVIRLNEESVSLKDHNDVDNVQDDADDVLLNNDNDPSLIPPVIRFCTKHIKDFVLLLKTPPSNRIFKTQFGTISPPFGETRLNITILFWALFTSNSKELNKILIKLEVIPLLTDLFFSYPWNNMLHYYYEALMKFIIENGNDELLDQVFKKSRIIERILSAFEENKKIKEEGGYRLGYMGFLVNISNYIQNQEELLKLDDYIPKILSEHQEWKAFASDVLEAENRLLQTSLGGPRPRKENKIQSDYEGHDDDDIFDDSWNSTWQEQDDYANDYESNGSDFRDYENNAEIESYFSSDSNFQGSLNPEFDFHFDFNDNNPDGKEDYVDEYEEEHDYQDEEEEEEEVQLGDQIDDQSVGNEADTEEEALQEEAAANEEAVPDQKND